MRYTIERLLNGDTNIVAHFQMAKKKWNELLDTKPSAPIAEWADWLSAKQISFFEHQCGGRWPGQEIMEWSGFATLYGAGFTNENRKLAKKLEKAFAASSCSIEVKGGARIAAQFYLDDEEEDDEFPDSRAL
jgi:hypothetical protein